ncbi:MAG: VanZ family protein [Bacteroidales bacterium]|nr:VanZ family protein [Bacteroidales bacterium]
MILMGLPGKCFPTVVNFWDWIGPDKIVHFILFGTFAFLTLWGYRKKIISKNNSYKKKAFLLALVLTISYGGLTELLQKYLFINRYGSVLDFLADAIGCVLGVIVFFFCIKKKLKKLKVSENNI